MLAQVLLKWSMGLCPTTALHRRSTEAIFRTTRLASHAERTHEGGPVAGRTGPMADGHEQEQAAGYERCAQGAQWHTRCGHEVVVWLLQGPALQQPQADVQDLLSTSCAATKSPRCTPGAPQGGGAR